MQIIRKLSEISDRYDALFCDVWGCVHNGTTSFHAAVKALETYRSGGGAVLLITNAPRPWLRVARQFDKIGFPKTAWDRIVTSGDAAKSCLFEGRVGRRIHYIGPPNDLGFLEPETDIQRKFGKIENVPLQNAQGIVCTGLNDERTEAPEDYRDAFLRAIDANLPFLCVNPDIVVDRVDRRAFCAGALGRLYEELGGRVLLFGKPRSEIYSLARKILSEIKSETVPAGRILCIGDGVETDIKGAARQNLPSLFVSGGLAAQETGTTVDPVRSRLLQFCESWDVNPDFVIGHLR